MVEIVNIVSTGSLGVELDLEKIASDVETIGEYDPNKHPGMYFRFEDESSIVTLYRTGKYIVTGAKSMNDAYAIRDRFLHLLSNEGMIENADDEWFQVQNLVCTAELDQTVDLNSLAIGLGLEKTEYEPEQFPGLIYRPNESDGVFLLFSSGRVVITGDSDIDSVEQEFKNLNNKVQKIL